MDIIYHFSKVDIICLNQVKGHKTVNNHNLKGEIFLIIAIKKDSIMYLDMVQIYF